MKRFLTAIMIFSSAPLWADISITAGSGTTIGTDAPGSVNYQKIKVCNGDTGSTNCGTIKATGILVDLSSTTNNATAVNVVSTQTTVFVVSVPTVTFNGSQQPVGANIVSVGTVAVVTGGTNGSLGVGGLAAAGASSSGNPLYNGGLVSSATLPAQQTDAKMQARAVDQYGRTVIQSGVPVGMMLIATATLSNTNTTVLVSSPAAGTYTYMCGCSIFNTSTTNTYVTLYPVGNNTSSANSMPLAAPANTVQSGAWPGCGSPFMRSTAASAIGIAANNSVTSLIVGCQYYQTN